MAAAGHPLDSALALAPTHPPAHDEPALIDYQTTTSTTASATTSALVDAVVQAARSYSHEEGEGEAEGPSRLQVLAFLQKCQPSQ